MQIICPNCGSKSPIEAGSLVTQTRIVCAGCAVEFAVELSDEQAAVAFAPPADERGLELFGAAGVAPAPPTEVLPVAEVAPESSHEILPAPEASHPVEVCASIELVPAGDPHAHTAGDVYEVLSLPEEAVIPDEAATGMADDDHSNVLDDIFASHAQFLESKLEGMPTAAEPPDAAEDYVTSPLHAGNEILLHEELVHEDGRSARLSDEVLETASDSAAEDGAEDTAETADDEREPASTAFAGEQLPPHAAAAQSFDTYGLGVRLMRVSPLWLLVSGLSFISFVVFCNWFFIPANLAQAGAMRPTSLRNEATNRSLASNAADPETTLSDSRNVGASRAALPAEAEIVNSSAKIDGPTPAPTGLPSPAPSAKPAAATSVEQSKAAETVAAQPATAGKFTLQVGSYNAPGEAEARAAGLKSAGQAVRVVEVEIPKRGKWYRVYVGGFGSRGEAEAHGKGLRERGLAESFIAAEAQ